MAISWSWISWNGFLTLKSRLISAVLYWTEWCHELLLQKRWGLWPIAYICNFLFSFRNCTLVNLSHPESFWVILSHLESFWVILSHPESLASFAFSSQFWPFWAILSHFESFWVILTHLSHFDSSWVILSYFDLFQSFWVILSHWLLMLFWVNF